jgi:hypothetical protein
MPQKTNTVPPQSRAAWRAVNLFPPLGISRACPKITESWSLPSSHRKRIPGSGMEFARVTTASGVVFSNNFRPGHPTVPSPLKG